MSAYITLRSPMTDQELLVQALQSVGFARDSIEVHSRPTALKGYSSSDRVADVIIRRDNLAVSYSDLGFERTPTGYILHVDDLDDDHNNPEWLSAVARHYQVSQTARDARREQERLRRRRELEEARRRHEMEMTRLAQLKQEAAARQRVIEEQRRLEAERRKLDEEARRAEEARAALVAAERDQVLARAKKMGYSVTESQDGDVVRLVLVKRTY